jgi:hypothetical protein
MRIFYDCEFIEDGRTIDLISIGMVREDGAELYLVNRDYDLNKLLRHAWLMENVVPGLPAARDASTGILHWNDLHPDSGALAARWQIAERVQDFILAVPDPQLWAWYGAYDHVVLCQLWGRMIDLPKGVPMWTNDLKQEAERLGNPRVPEQGPGEHDALADARHNRVIAEFLASA